MSIKSTSLIIGFSLLVCATLAIGVLSLRLMRNEAELLAYDSRRALEDRVQMVADDLRLAVQGVENELLAQVEALDPKQQPRVFGAWPETHPLVRNAYVWNSSLKRFEWPDPEAPATEEEKGFVRRYESLFANRLGGLLTPPEKGAPEARDNASARLSVQREVLQFKAKTGAAPQRGWVPWFEGDQLYLLGWVEQPGRLIGVELEMMALLSRITPVLPRDDQTDRTWALLDGAGNIVHQSGTLAVAKGTRPFVSAGMGTVLPHWQVALFSSRLPMGGAPGGVRLMSRLLVAALMTSILTGGGLLLWEAGRRAREARQKTTFVSNVSHELKTPLTTLRLYAELLREGRVKGEDKQRHYLDVMISECARLGRLVNNMLDFSRLEQHRRVYSLESLDLTAWLDLFLEPQRIRLAQAGLQVLIHSPGGAVVVRTDRDALEQALLNLLDNGVKYAAAGKVVEVTLKTRDDVVQLEVADRGPGVPESLREKVFEDFFRVNEALTTRIPGSGLGLSIARRLMRDIGADVVCVPTGGRGACFQIVMRCS